jgi:hypothetical protein
MEIGRTQTGGRRPMDLHKAIEKLKTDIPDWQHAPAARAAALARAEAVHTSEQRQREHQAAREAHAAAQKRAERLEREGASSAELAQAWTDVQRAIETERSAREELARAVTIDDAAARTAVREAQEQTAAAIARKNESAGPKARQAVVRFLKEVAEFQASASLQWQYFDCGGTDAFGNRVRTMPNYLKGQRQPLYPAVPPVAIKALQEWLAVVDARDGVIA